MGSRRIGLARTQALIQQLKRELQMNGSKFVGEKEKIMATSSATTLTAADSGATIVWTHNGATGYNITLPKCATGLRFTVRFEIGTAIGGHHIAVGDASDRFFGTATVMSTTADKSAVQSKAKAATGAKFIHTQSDIATTGGNAGDVIEIVAIDDTHWLVNARLHTSNAAPSGLTVFKDS
jgi:hypothetical protein